MLPHPAGMNGELAGAAGAAAYAAGLHNMSPQMSAAAAAAAVAAYGRSPMVSMKEDERLVRAAFHGAWEHLPCGCSSGGRAVNPDDCSLCGHFCHQCLSVSQNG